MTTHSHKCAGCGTVWEHEDQDREGAEFDQSHSCPSCGRLATLVATDAAAAATNPAATKPKDQGHALETFHRFVDAALPTLHRSELATWIVLLRLAGEEAIGIDPSQIAIRAGCEYRAAQRALRSLRKAGLVQQVRKGGPGLGKSVYRVLRPKAPITWQYFEFNYMVARQRQNTGK